MKTTGYFTNNVLAKRDYLTLELCQSVIENAVKKEVQADGRIRVWGQVGERWMRVVLLEDGETIHNAFFDRRFKP